MRFFRQHHTSLVWGALLLTVVFLLGSVLPIAGSYQLLMVETGSMAPTIPAGSVVLVMPQSEYETGDVITFTRDGDAQATTHRIVRKEATAEGPIFVVRGDANAAEDMRPVRPAEVVGRVVASVPYVGYVLVWAHRPLGLLLLVGLPALWIIWEQARVIKRELKNTSTKSNIVL